MDDNTLLRYDPDYVVAPGEVLGDYLDDFTMSQSELAQRTGLAKKTINEIIMGKSPITSSTALKLERVLGRPAHVWSNLERLYADELARREDHARLQVHLDWLEGVPVERLVKLGCIPPSTDQAPSYSVSTLEHVLDFFGIAGVDQWRATWDGYRVACRNTDKIEKQAKAIFAWLRQGEKQARHIACNTFERKQFKSLLIDIRRYTKEAPELFVPVVTSLCASAGVALVFVPELGETGVNGAARHLGKHALIQMSLRRTFDDQFWFTFFHEAAHLLKHGRKKVYLDDNFPPVHAVDARNSTADDLETREEKEANTFARELLIPSADLAAFLDSGVDLSSSAIMQFADDIGVAPGLVVGRLQQDGRIPASSPLNTLKAAYHWDQWRI